LSDIKTAVSEAVTNAIVHGYGMEPERELRMDEMGAELPKVELACRIEEGSIYIEIEDRGVGIADIEEAMQPLFTTKPTLERTGMGFSFMEAFMDEVQVESRPGAGTKVILKRNLNEKETKEEICGKP
jgi:stage II sporulation protein AB (anti-sigma F factor)